MKVSAIVCINIVFDLFQSGREPIHDIYVEATTGYSKNLFTTIQLVFNEILLTILMV